MDINKDAVMRLTQDGTAKAVQWRNDQRRVAQLRQELSRAETDLMNTEREFAKWLMPDKPVVGEKIAVWIGDTLVMVEVTNQFPKDGKVMIRQQGCEWETME